MPDRDFYPQSMDARAAWHANYTAKIEGAFATKYGVTAAMLASILVDNTWIQYWVAQRHQLDTGSQQVTSYFNTIAGKDSEAPAPTAITFSVPTDPATAPAQPPTGIEKRVRDIAKFIKNNPAYSKADGEALGIELPSSGGGQGPGTGDTAKPVIEWSTRVAFEVGAKFRKYGMDGIRIEYRHAGGDWLPGGTLLSSPGHITVVPKTPNTPEQIELRAAYLKGNSVVGDWSDTGSVYIGP